jgi:hypothetical protein
VIQPPALKRGVAVVRPNAEAWNMSKQKSEKRKQE